ncbi:MAG: ATP-binding protein [Proteobacteria bacterium]|nr:ATP-binding protein [Pseudomonadota bacterium]
MLSKIKTPIIKKLFLILSIAMFTQFFLSLSLNVFGYYVDLKDSIYKNVESKLEKIKSSVERITNLGIPIKELPPLNEDLEKEIKDEPIIFLAILDEKGGVLFHSDPILIGTKVPVFLEEIVNIKEASSVIQPYGSVNIILKPIFDAKSSKIGYIIAGYKPDFIYKKILMVFLRMSLSSALAGFLGFFLIYFFYRRDVAVYLDKFLLQVEKIRKGTFEEFEIASDENEFSAVSEAMNKMVKELKKTFNEKEELLLKLYREEEKLRKIIEKTEIGIAVVKDDTIVFANPGFYKIFNFNAESPIIGQDIFRFVPEESETHFKNILHQVMEKEENIQIDTIKMLDLAKNEIYCSLEANLLETSEWGRRVISLTFQNITEKIRYIEELKEKNKTLEILINKYQSTQIALQISNEKLENALMAIEKANEELKKVDSLKDVFFSTISHELKTPISLIQGYIGILKNDPAIKKSNVSTDIIDAIDRASKRLLNLTEEIMELLKIKSGKITLNLNLTSIKTLMQSITPEIDHFLKMKNIQLIFQNLEDLPIVNVDSKRLETVFRNLIVNAIKFTKEGGKITVTGSIETENGTNYIKISIRDEGCGISKFNLDKIFNEFFTLPPPPNVSKISNLKGSGLGLSIAKGIIEAHRGKIWAESEGYDPEKYPGATFYIMIPVTNEI